MQIGSAFLQCLLEFEKKAMAVLSLSGKWCVAAVWSFFVSLISFSFLRFLAPFSFSLCSYESSAVGVLRAGFRSVLAYISVKGGVVNLIVFKSFDAKVQLIFDFKVFCLVKRIRISEISGVELKI